MFCQECGKFIPDGSRFCEHCGTAVPVDEIFPGQTDASDRSRQPENDQQTGYDTQKNGGNPQSDERGPSGTGGRETANDKPDSFDPSMRENQTGGKNREAAARKKQPAGQPVPKKERTPEEQAANAKKKKIAAIIAGAAAAAVVVLIVLKIVITPAINLNNYMTLSAEGYDTVGKAVVTFDVESFAEDYGSKLDTSSSGGSALTTAASSSQSAVVYQFLYNSGCVSWSVDQESGLSNGDTITLTWDCDSDYAEEKYGYQLKCETITYTVKDLEEAETFNPFEGVEVVFEGIAPNGTAYVDVDGITSTEEAMGAIGYTLDVSSGLSNGDTVTVSVITQYSDDAITYCAETYGKIPSPAEITYTVSGLQSYVTAVSDISDESLAELKAEAAEIFNEDYGVDNWEDTESLSSLDYIGTYLLTTKDTENYWDYNRLYLVYKAQIKNNYSDDDEDESYSKTNTVYWYVEFYDVTADEEGELEVDEEYYSLPYFWTEFDSEIGYGWGTYSWSYRGYASLSELYDDAIDPELDDYTCESLVDESAGESMDLTGKDEDEDDDDEEDGIIFPNSSEELLSQSDIEDLSDEDLQSAINEIYARNGYIFEDEDLLEFYRQYDWYEEKVKKDDFSMDLFNDIEYENVELLQEERESRS